MKLTENQKRWIDYMLHGMGLFAAKKEFTKKERQEMEILVDLKLAYFAKNHTYDKTGMYHIPLEERKRIKEFVDNIKK